MYEDNLFKKFIRIQNWLTIILIVGLIYLAFKYL